MSRLRSLRFGKRYFVTCLLVGITFSLAGCVRTQEEDPLADYSFITQEPCGPPCWYGLEIGQSSEAELIRKLDELSFVDEDSVKTYEGYSLFGDSNAKIVKWNCIHPLKRGCGQATIAHEKIKYLGLSINYDLSFEQTVDIYGPPDYVEYRPAHPESGGCVISLTWLDLQIVVEDGDLRKEEPCEDLQATGRLKADTQVTSVDYFAREVLEAYTGEGSQRMDWPGFEEEPSKDQ